MIKRGLHWIGGKKASRGRYSLFFRKACKKEQESKKRGEEKKSSGFEGCAFSIQRKITHGIFKQ